MTITPAPARAAQLRCPDCGHVFADTRAASSPPWLTRRDPRLRSRDVLEWAARAGRRGVTSREAAGKFKVTIFDASKRLRTLGKSGMLARAGKRSRAISWVATAYGRAKAKEYGRNPLAHPKAAPLQ